MTTSARASKTRGTSMLTDNALRALYVLAAEYHSGFGSRGYRLMCHVTRLMNKRDIGVGCGPDHERRRSTIGCWDFVHNFPEYQRYLPVAQRYF